VKAAVGLRLAVLGVVAVSLFGALITRLWYLQVLTAPSYQLAAEQNQVRLIPLPAPRGRILDRHGEVIVDNRMSTVVTVDRTALDPDHRPVLLARLAALLGEPVDVVATRLDDRRRNPVLPVPVAEEVGDEVVVAIRERPDLFDPKLVSAHQVAVRSYPHGPLAAHVVGYVGEINDRELEAHHGEGYRLGDEIGKSGVELVHEDALRGSVGFEKLEIDSSGRALGVLGRREPVRGSDVYLSIDITLQRSAEVALVDGLESNRARVDRETGRRYESPAGSVVIIDPRDGGVLAMASHPTYDPSEFVGGISFDLFDRLQDPANHSPLNNRAIQGEYAPGSTFKLITATAALLEGLITPQTTITDRGSIRVGNRTFRNAGSRSYGAVALTRAITVSSDVFFYLLGRSFWEEAANREGIQDTARAYGLGTETGIDLPFEADGRVPDAATRRALHAANPDAFPESRWFTGDNVNLAIGQGELVVTPLQLANAYATFANGGNRLVPHVVHRIESSLGRTVFEAEAVVAGRVDLAPDHAAAMLSGLRNVTSSTEGTAVFAFSGFDQSSYPVAGKTGTAQIAGTHDTAVFVAFAPADAPELAVVVVMEESGFGSTAAAPVARRILEVAAGHTEPIVRDLVATPLAGDEEEVAR